MTISEAILFITVVGAVFLLGLLSLRGIKNARSTKPMKEFPVPFDPTKIDTRFRGWPRGSGATTIMLHHYKTVATANPNDNFYLVFGNYQIAANFNQSVADIPNLHCRSQRLFNANELRGLRNLYVAFDQSVDVFHESIDVWTEAVKLSNIHSKRKGA